MAEAKKIFYAGGQFDTASRFGWIKKRPMTTKVSRMPTLTATMYFSALPTARAPIKFTAVKMTMINVAKTFTYRFDTPAGRNVVA